MNDSEQQDSSRDIAVVGLACRFPGANNVAEYWANLVGAVESISRLSDDELRAAGVSEQLISHPSYVKASGFIEDPELFDAEFFGFNAREAEVTDPQHRVFLECAWEALENAGYGAGFNGPVAVYAGSSMNTYYLCNVLTNPEAAAAAGGYQVFIGNDKDFVPTRVSYKLNLKGPSFTVQTACSTSLVAVQIACQSLLTYQSDLALAGGVSLFFPQKTGYFYQEGMILSPDGHCRAFDAKGQGTLGGQGVGIVVLKRLQEALRDGDTIHAVIKGSAINNDGSAKVGFTAPSVDGQAEVIAMAQAMAGVEPTSISYVEAHGTATPLGDPVEIAALTQVFRASTDAKRFCAIGSVKTNIGHLDAAAGVAGLIKTVLALENKVIPASLHFEQPNPQIDFENGPFFVNSRTTEWKTTHGAPRRAGVSSFGIGGTNAHVILEEAPPHGDSVTRRPQSLLVLSARSEQALDRATENLATHLQQHPETDVVDAAYTLQVGRRVFPYRRSLVVSDRAAAIAALTDGAARLPATYEERSDQAVVFMFSGQGSQYPGMAAELYRHEFSFSADVDRCAKVLKPLVGCDLRELIFSSDGDRASARAADLSETRLAQPALFVVEYALANLWIRWGVKPYAMIGHSIGEYAAATIAGVLSLEDALATVALRGSLMQGLPAGSMLAVPLAAEALANRLDKDVALAAVNGPAFCTVSGEASAIEAFQSKLAAEGVECRRLHTSHAFHSAMMDPVLEPFVDHMRRVRLNAPRIRYISNVSGTWIMPEEATDPLYWARHLRGTVRFAEGLRQLLESNRVFLEVGPGNVLCTFARQSAGPSRGAEIHASLPHAAEKVSDFEFSLRTLGRLWQCGAPVDWSALHSDEKLRRVPLPTYPFERKRYFLDPKQRATVVPKADFGKRKNVVDWLYLPSWKRSELLSSTSAEALHWLFLSDEQGLSQQVAQSLVSAGHKVTHVRAGHSFEIGSNGDYTLNPFRREDYAALFSDLARRGGMPSRIVSFFNVTEEGSDWDCWRSDAGAAADYPGFASLLALGQALASERGIEGASVFLVSNYTHSVTGDEPIVPLKSLALGLCRVIPQECPQIRCRNIDVPTKTPSLPALTQRIVQELCSDEHEPTVVYRGNARWVQTYEPIKQADPSRIPTASWIRDGGTYLITGGLGSVGMLFAEHLARRARARLVLTGRSGLPERREWTAWIDSHEADDPTAKRIQRILAMEEIGAEVMVCSADVSEREQMRSVLQAAAQRFGRIDGVIHAAGSTNGSFVMDTGPDQYEAHFSSKVRGAQVIEELFEGERLDFCLLVSSLSSILGGLGFGAYSAANFFLDAVAQKRRAQSDSQWRSINWDGWDFLGGDAQHSGVGASLLALAMTPEESLVALDLIQSMSAPTQIAVSTGNLETRLAQWVARDQLGGVEADSAVDASTQHARPQLKSAYVAPRNEAEQQVVEIWAQLLGIGQIGIHDNFFELGGHSLLGTRVLARVQETFGVKLPLRAIFELPTAAELAERVQAVVWANKEVPAEQTAADELEELEF